MDKKVLILLYKPISERHRFVFNFLFNENMGLQYSCTSNLSHFVDANNSLKVNYSGKPNDRTRSIDIYNYGLLQETGITDFEIPVNGCGLETQLFPSLNNTAFTFDFDLFSAMFYLLSRYEEYLNFEADIHGRFKSSNSIAHKYSFLQFPLVDYWIDLFRKRLNEVFELNIKKAPFQFQPTYDIDIAWAFKNKGLLRNANTIVRLLKTRNKKLKHDIINTITGKRKDPYQVFDYLDKVHKNFKTENPIYFFAVGKWSSFDKNTPVSNRAFKNLIKEIQKNYLLGIHPSYRSNKSFYILKSELDKLKNILNESVLKSRQHYLKLVFPDTYYRLSKSGIQEDYTLGYSDNIGFRASCSRSFLWYDLRNEKISAIRLFPFQVMDVTLFNYLNLKPTEAINEVRIIVDRIKHYGGSFRTIWHNSSFYKEEGWTAEHQAVFEQIFEYTSKINLES